MAFAIDKIRGAVATGANGSPRQIAKLHSLAVADAEVPTVIQLSRLNIARAVLVELHDGHVELHVEGRTGVHVDMHNVITAGAGIAGDIDSEA